ncbi:MAG: hypothetical protein ABIJ39_08700 [Chloroflexota bacterium]
MAGKTRTFKDYPITFQITKIEKDKYVLLGVFTKKQLETLMGGLHEDYEERASGWRGQYQALAKAIVAAYEKLEQK